MVAGDCEPGIHGEADWIGKGEQRALVGDQQPLALERKMPRTNDGAGGSKGSEVAWQGQRYQIRLPLGMLLVSVSQFKVMEATV